MTRFTLTIPGELFWAAVSRIRRPHHLDRPARALSRVPYRGGLR